MVYPYIGLIISILSFWIIGDRKITLIIFCISVAVAVLVNVISLAAVPLVLGFVYLCYSFSRSTVIRSTYLKIGMIVLFIVGCVALSAHSVPGFYPVLVIDSQIIKPGAPAYHQLLHFDKGIVGLVLLVVFCSPARSIKSWKIIVCNQFPFVLLALCTLFPLAVILDYVKFDPQISPVFIDWALPNLFFTCIAEEVFFRAIVQHHVSRCLSTFIANGRWVGLGLTALLFGLVHLGGGWVFAVLATLAGLLYGGIYLKTRFIEASILLHFFINSIHFLLFTYPYLSQG